MHSDSIILPILYTGNPNLKDLEVKERKRLFLNLMLPSVLIAQRKLEKDKAEIRGLNEKQILDQLNSSDSLKVDSLLNYFKSKNLDEVINRMHTHPVSIILAQAAVESGWGTSRFFTEANNVFGVWSYNATDKRIKASEHRGSKAIYLKSYDQLCNSVYDYLITIARAPAYSGFRKARQETNDPYELIEHLSKYSEMRDLYVDMLRAVIRQNKLPKYDHYELAAVSDNDPAWTEF
jgi:Bax protein